MIITLSKPFLRTMNSEPITEIDLDFNKLTAKQYIDSYNNMDQKELDLIAYGKLGWFQARNLIASAVDCIPEMLDEMPLLPDYRTLEKQCFMWFATSNFDSDIELDFNKMGLQTYLSIRSENAMNELDTLSTRASAKTRLAIISSITKKSVQELEEMSINDYIPLDMKCASFFSELV